MLKRYTWVALLLVAMVPAALGQPAPGGSTAPSAPSTLSAQPDWLDDFPTVNAAVLAALEELKVDAARNNAPARLRDEDMIAAQIVGTLILLRQVLFLKFNDEPPMAKDREVKLKALYAAYSETELVIGQGAAVRRGYITRPDTGRGCRIGDPACYRRWFANDSTNLPISAEYRRRVLTRLFPCGDRAKEMIDLRQRYAVKTPHLPSPAVTGQIDPEVAGIAPAGCTAFGGDANGNGLCDGWEHWPDRNEPPRAAGVSTIPAGGIRLTELRHAYLNSPTRGLKVSMNKDNAIPGSSACFRVMRADKKSLGARKQIWHGPATIEFATDKPDLSFALVASGVDFGVDAQQPFLLVEITSGPSYGAVRCEQPLMTWELEHRKLPHNGLHGPYANVDAAMKMDDAARLALRMTSNVEVGYTIMRNTRAATGSPSYYVTPPTRSSDGPAAGQPQVPPKDFFVSFKRAFDGSCEDPSVYKLAALVHTHPLPRDGTPRLNNFSMDDFNQAIGVVRPGWSEFGEGMFIDTQFESTVMIDADDRYIRAFEPRVGDEKFSDIIDKYVVPSEWSELWGKYTSERVRIISHVPR